MIRPIVNLIVTIILAVAKTVFARDYNAIWSPASGRLPGSVCPTRLLVNTADVEQPHFEGDSLVLSTSVSSEDMYYEQNGSVISVSDTLRIEFQMRLVSGNGSHSAYAPFEVAFVVAADRGNRRRVGPMRSSCGPPTG